MNLKLLWEAFTEDEKDEITRIAVTESKNLAEWLVGKEDDAQELVDACNKVISFVTIPTKSSKDKL